MWYWIQKEKQKTITTTTAVSQSGAINFEKNGSGNISLIPSIKISAFIYWSPTINQAPAAGSTSIEIEKSTKFGFLEYKQKTSLSGFIENSFGISWPPAAGTSVSGGNQVKTTNSSQTKIQDERFTNTNVQQ